MIHSQRFLQTVLAFAVALLMLLTSGTLLLSVKANFATLEGLAEQSLMSTAIAIASTIERIMATGDSFNNRKNSLRDLLSDRTVAYAMIIDRHGEIIFHSNSNLEGASMKELDNEQAIISLNMQGRKLALKTGLMAYEFNYLLHLDEGSYLLKIALHTFQADNILKRAENVWWSIAAVVIMLWLAGGALILTVSKYANLINKRRQEEQWTAIGRMSALIAHEIRNALGSIKGFTQWIDEKTEASDTRKNVLSLIIKGTTRVENLINDMLQYSRQESYSLESIKLKVLIEEAICQFAVGNKGIIETDIAEDLKVIADREKLLRTIVNVLQNAVQAMDDGGIIRLQARATRGWVELTIKDNGCGIDDELLNRVFEPFFTTKAKGTGLGLAYCKKVIQGMGGDITIANRSDSRGVVVAIRLKRG